MNQFGWIVNIWTAEKLFLQKSSSQIRINYINEFIIIVTLNNSLIFHLNVIFKDLLCVCYLYSVCRISISIFFCKSLRARSGLYKYNNHYEWVIEVNWWTGCYATKVALTSIIDDVEHCMNVKGNIVGDFFNPFYSIPNRKPVTGIERAEEAGGHATKVLNRI